MDDLISLVSDENKEAFKEKFTKHMSQVDSRIETLEAKLLDSEKVKKDIVSKRDKLKSDMKQLLEKLQVSPDLLDNEAEGVDSIYDQLRKNLTNEKTEVGRELNKSADILKILKEKHTKEIDTLKKQWEDERKVNQNKLNDILFEKEGDALCNKFNVKPAFKKAFLKQIRDDNSMSLEGDRFVFKNEDGTTMRKSGDEVTLSSYVESFHSDPNNAEWFQSSQQPSGVPYSTQAVEKSSDPDSGGMFKYLAENPWS